MKKFYVFALSLLLPCAILAMEEIVKTAKENEKEKEYEKKEESKRIKFLLLPIETSDEDWEDVLFVPRLFL